MIIYRYFYNYRGRVFRMRNTDIIIIYNIVVEMIILCSWRSSRRRRTCTLHTVVLRCVHGARVCIICVVRGISFASDHRNIVDRPRILLVLSDGGGTREWCRLPRLPPSVRPTRTIRSALRPVSVNTQLYYINIIIYRSRSCT